MQTSLYIIFKGSKQVQQCATLKEVERYMNSNHLITTKKLQAGATLYLFTV